MEDLPRWWGLTERASTDGTSRETSRNSLSAKIASLFKKHRFPAVNHDDHILSQENLDLLQEQVEGTSSNCRHSLGAANTLRNRRVDGFLADDGPRMISADEFQVSEKTKRALAEIDGMYAGWRFLHKVEDGRDARPLWPFIDQSICGFGAWNEAMYPDRNSFIIPLPAKLDLPGHDSQTDPKPLEVEPDAPKHEPKSPAHPTTTDTEKAWKGLHSLRTCMEVQFQHFTDVASTLTSPSIRELCTHFPSSEVLADRGMLAYRDVLNGLLPHTLAEIFAFASLSYTVSEILVQSGQIRDGQVLSGLQLWGDCIRDVDEKDAFDALVSKMWPSSSIFASQPVHRPSSAAPGNGDSLDPPEHQDDTSHSFQQAAAEMGILFAPPDADQQITPLAHLSQDAQDMMGFTEEEFNFSQFRDLYAYSADYVPPLGIDPRELARFSDPERLIPGYRSPPPSPGSCPASPTPPLPPLGSFAPSGCLYEFRISDHVSDCAVVNLQNTVVFLAVFVFAKNMGDYFYLLSGGGKTVACSKPGSAFAGERSKTERRLRREFFEPLKRAGADDARFLALLAVAKKFVILGLLGTEEKVQDYLLTVSKEFLPDGTQVKFVRWIFGQSRGSSTPSSTTTGKPSKRRAASDVEPEDRSGGKEKRRVLQCEHPECEATFYSPSGLSKHKKKHDTKVQEFPCKNCSYASDRRDILRQHFLRQHGPNLPPELQETRRGHA